MSGHEPTPSSNSCFPPRQGSALPYCQPDEERVRPLCVSPPSTCPSLNRNNSSNTLTRRSIRSNRYGWMCRGYRQRRRGAPSAIWESISAPPMPPAPWALHLERSIASPRILAIIQRARKPRPLRRENIRTNESIVACWADQSTHQYHNFALNFSVSSDHYLG